MPQGEGLHEDFGDEPGCEEFYQHEMEAQEEMAKLKKEDNKTLLQKAVDLLASGDDTGCDGLVVVGYKEYMELRKFVHELTGEWHGCIEQEGDDEEADEE